MLAGPAQQEDDEAASPEVTSDPTSAAPAAGEATGGGHSDIDDTSSPMQQLVTSQQLLGAHFLNMARLRRAVLPGVSMHGSARALCSFYDGVTTARLLPASLVDDLVAHGAATAGAKGVRWAAGFQLGVCTDSSSRQLTALGHGAAGGTIGLCMPEAELSVAVTVSKLSPNRLATRKLIEAMLGEYSLKLAPTTMGLLQDS